MREIFQSRARLPPGCDLDRTVRAKLERGSWEIEVVSQVKAYCGHLHW